MHESCCFVVHSFQCVEDRGIIIRYISTAGGGEILATSQSLHFQHTWLRSFCWTCQGTVSSSYTVDIWFPSVPLASPVGDIPSLRC